MRAASCCSVEVVNGAAGRRVYGFDSTFETVRATPSAAQRGGERLGGGLVERDGLALQRAGVVEVAAGGDALAVEADQPRLERRASSPLRR